ncbi:conserved hypothetical protein [Talaromyces stipitatus ATCC 10500]|uniref:Uncharacterized protein n=1 Tax=Talaromyces stipitatus (strain ATCC 10500 / CBS 375.48 / QM 6759 / NRRL 1006) TaxID=441959 RepID=B8M4G8_TALSN|nr:uncharacterized protein TSTA_024850 [Talaromyces stipitatus ATCC 10500]EED19163.1 conserved hypothetical protein [Talaromyces stipitatus ATCC 10500]
MNTLRRCHSAPLDIQSLGRLDSGFQLSVSTRRQKGTKSLRLPSISSERLRTGQYPNSEKLLTTLEPISPLFSDSQQVLAGLDVPDPDSSEREISFQIEEGIIHEFSDNKPSKRETTIQNGEGFADTNSQSRPPKRISDAIQLVINDQQKVSGMRVQLAEMRSSLDESRNLQIYQWTNALKELKSILSNAPGEKGNDSDEYLIRENEYQNFQRRLEAEESSLQRRETYVAELLREFSSRSRMTESYINNPNNKKVSNVHQGPWAMTGNDADANIISAQMEAHPLIGKYLSALGDVRMYEERLAELSLEHAEIAGREASFALVDRSLDEESQEFLANYESEYLELERIIADKMDAAVSLREQCEKEGIPIPSMIDEFDTELDFDIRQALPQERDLLWISELDEENTFYELAQSKDFNIYNFINTWIFHQLRHSTSQIYRYKSNPRLQGLKIDEDSLSEWAMRLWFQDGNAKMASPLRSPEASE